MDRERPIQIVSKSVKKKHRNKSDLGEDFIAPDGGWGWLVAIASGLSLLVSLTVMQQFGILFRKRFNEIGISNPQITTIINTQQAAATCSGLFNGPIFRRFTYRQVALVGAILIFIGLLAAVSADTAISYFLTISIMYGVGRGLIYSASNIALNTYFREKRRSATSCQYAVAGLGPIFLPYVSTYLLDEYGVAGAVLFYAGFSLNNFACALIFQPVKWHMKDQNRIELRQFQPLNVDVLEAAFESNQRSQRRSLSNSINENPRIPENSVATFAPLIAPAENIVHEENHMLEKPQEKQDKKDRSCWQRIAIFLDLDLLKDLTYVNLAVGLTLIHFVEMNFAFLTPFILHDFHFDDNQIAMAMSLLGFCDIVMRMLIPFATRNLKISNNVLLVCAILATLVGRTILIVNRNFTVVLVCFGWMGLCKAIRLVFCNLILPSYMPLKRLPAGIGLQRTIMGLFTLVSGPFLGLIRDASNTNYGFTLLCMNAMSCFVAIAWISEDLYKWLKQKSSIPQEEGQE